MAVECRLDGEVAAIKEIKCPYCGEETVFVAKMSFYKCPSCTCEIWPPGNEDVTRGGPGIYWEEIHRGSGKSSSNKSKHKKRLNKRSHQVLSRHYIID